MTTDEHDLRYRVGTMVTEPHWHCACEKWRFTAHPMALRKTGNNEIEAKRAYAMHVKGAE